MTVDHWPDPIHDERPNRLLWSRANMTEAIPGVATALTWTFWEHGFTAANRDLWGTLGVLDRDEARRPQGVRPEDDFVSIFYGRPVVNVDRVRDLFARVPGGDPDQFERQMLGSVRPDAASARRRDRWPHLLLQAPRRLAGLGRRAEAVERDTAAWWRRVTSRRLPDAPAASTALRDAVERFDRVQLVHGLCLMTGQLAFERVASICRRVDRQDLALDVAAAGSGSHESALVDDLWAVADGWLTLDGAVLRHGYHGPDEGALHRPSWREDPRPLAAIVARYRELDPRPVNDVAHRRADAIETVASAYPRPLRGAVRASLAGAGASIVRRETTKAAFLQAIDSARFAARSLGEHLAAVGRLDDPDDVFHLTLTEASAPDVRPDRAVVAVRRATWLTYHDVEVPTHFVGTPSPTTRTAHTGTAAAEARPRSLAGIGACSGAAEGVARVVTDPADPGALAPGEVLVCHQTDPAWVPLLVVAAAAVVEVGGPLSHAAIVARELGVPCVVAVDGATRLIEAGTRVRVDGTSGTVEVLR